MTFRDDALDRLAPAIPWQDDWSDVLRRAGEREPRRVGPRHFLRRRLVIALVVLAAVLIPLAALAAANDWWFLRSGSAPPPTHAASRRQMVGEEARADWGTHTSDNRVS
jgi:hypothetical protein